MVITKAKIFEGKNKAKLEGCEGIQAPPPPPPQKKTKTSVGGSMDIFFEPHSFFLFCPNFTHRKAKRYGLV